MSTNSRKELNRKVSHCIEDTIQSAREWAELLRGHSIGLNGALGAGKTIFVRGLVAATGGDPWAVRSPTFTLMNIYNASPVFYHFDLFRLDHVSELDGIGFFDFLEMPGTKAIEWVDKFDDASVEMDFIIQFDSITQDPDTRILTLLK